MNIKEEAHKLVETLAENSTWDDQIYVRQAVEEGIQDADAGRLHDSEAVRAKFGLPQK
jgi:predicted transcriptional regulator